MHEHHDNAWSMSDHAWTMHYLVVYFAWSCMIIHWHENWKILDNAWPCMITHGQCIIMHYHGVHALSLIIMHDYVVFFMLFSILSNLVQHSSSPRRKRIWESALDSIQLTLLVIYDDGLCSLCYTTNLLKDSGLASIGSSYDKNAKMGTSVLIPEHCDILPMWNCKEPVNFIFWRCNMLAYQIQLYH